MFDGSHLLDSAIFSSFSVHTGVVREILAKSAFTAMTRPPVERDPMFTISTSPWVQVSILGSTMMDYAPFKVVDG